MTPSMVISGYVAMVYRPSTPPGGHNMYQHSTDSFSHAEITDDLFMLSCPLYPFNLFRSKTLFSLHAKTLLNQTKKIDLVGDSLLEICGQIPTAFNKLKFHQPGLRNRLAKPCSASAFLGSFS